MSRSVILGECAKLRAHAHGECLRMGIRIARSELSRAHTHGVRPRHSPPLELIRGPAAWSQANTWLACFCQFASGSSAAGDPDHQVGEYTSRPALLVTKRGVMPNRWIASDARLG